MTQTSCHINLSIRSCNLKISFCSISFSFRAFPCQRNGGGANFLKGTSSIFLSYYTNICSACYYIRNTMFRLLSYFFSCVCRCIHVSTWKRQMEQRSMQLKRAFQDHSPFSLCDFHDTVSRKTQKETRVHNKPRK